LSEEITTRAKAYFYQLRKYEAEQATRELRALYHSEHVSNEVVLFQSRSRRRLLEW
jgi:hypothetical protein